MYGLMEQENQPSTIRIPIFGNVNINELKSVNDRDSVYITLRVGNEGQISWDPQPDFRGVINDSSDGFIPEMELYPKNPDAGPPYNSVVFPNNAKQEDGERLLPIIPFLRRDGDEVVVQGLQFRFTANKLNKDLEKGIYKIYINYTQYTTDRKEKKLNAVPNGDLFITSVDMKRYGREDANDQPPVFAPIELNNGNSEPFVFDTIDLQPESEQAIDAFIENINSVKIVHGQQIYDEYIRFLSRNPIRVKAYSSRDNDPNERVQGNFQPCRGFGDGTRGQYNLCLSQARADKIAQMLNERLPQLNFVGEGLGETTEFGPGWTRQNPTTSDQTLPNRRFVVTLPEFRLTRRIR